MCASQLQAITDEIQFLSITMIAIAFYRRLENISITSTSSTRLVLSCKNILQYLSRYVADKSHPSYKRLTNNIGTQLLMAIQIQEVNISESMLVLKEYCHHCDMTLEFGSEQCASGHSTSRCCITFLQVKTNACQEFMIKLDFVIYSCRSYRIEAVCSAELVP